MLTDEVKTALRVSTDDTAINTEIDNLVSEAESDLKTTGIKCDKDSYDPLVKGAIILYCRSRFGLVKLGQPQPASNLSIDENKGSLLITST